MITLENYEEYMMMHADGELQPHEEVALQAFLNDNPTLKAEMALYETVRLTPDHSLVYKQKESLMKPLAEKKVIALPRFRTYAVAAGVAALIVCTVFALRQGNSSNQDLPPVATNTPVDSIKPTITNNPKEQLVNNTTPTSVNDAPAQVQTPKQEKAIKTLPIDNTTGVAKVKQVQKHNDNEGLAVTTRTQQTMYSVPVSKFNELPVEKTQPAAVATVNVPGYELPQIENEEKRSWIDRLPLEESKKKSLSNVALAVANKCEQISEFKENVTENISKKHLSLRVEHKNLIVSF
ncbi:hypothetical protein CJD36_012030 [Flavipsychrobacter stenotrophus]|uniref:Uncharacterized protein n=1 Tax=Flavipsychrobacter stenotrophus TaxID=2077091 RepID=A0A2S7SVD7_9BACT|nr:hypothetical protein [Flavipsychrobacter stenotrophus]PQJ10694.1 hypothetical protein CJD36_012030 [Flavipsychrobacter stenotrophus]